MNKKQEENLKKGMAIGAAPFEEKFRLVGDDLERIGNDLSEKIDTGFQVQEEINDFFNSEITEIKRKELFKYNTIYDIKDEDVLGCTEQEYLVSYLIALANQLDNVNEHQQKYVRNIRIYLGSTVSGATSDLTCVENIEKTNGQIAFLQVVMEFLFLATEDFSLIEEKEDLLSYFFVNKKCREQIKQHILTMFKAIGADGISEKYQEEREEIDEVELIPRETFCNTAAGMEFKISNQDFYWVNISELLDKIAGKNVKVIAFENCKLYYSFDASESCLRLNENDKVIIKNCSIFCGSKLKNAFHMQNRSEIVIENSYIDNAREFIKNDYKADTKVTIKDTKILNPHDTFVSTEYIDIWSSEIIFNNQSMLSGNGIIAYKGIIRNCKISGCEGYQDKINYSFISGQSVVVENCIIKNMAGSICVNKISHCTLHNCTGIIVGETSIVNTVFNKCYKLNRFEEGGNSQVIRCLFYDCSDLFEAFRKDIFFDNSYFISCQGFLMKNMKHTKIYNCEFRKISAQNKNSIISTFGKNIIEIVESNFYDIKVDNGYLIDCTGEGADRYKIILDSCNFYRCNSSHNENVFIHDTIKEIVYVYAPRPKLSLWEKITLGEFGNSSGGVKIPKETGNSYQIAQYKNCKGINRYLDSEDETVDVKDYISYIIDNIVLGSNLNIE